MLENLNNSTKEQKILNITFKTLDKIVTSEKNPIIRYYCDKDYEELSKIRKKDYKIRKNIYKSTFYSYVGIEYLIRKINPLIKTGLIIGGGIIIMGLGFTGSKYYYGKKYDLIPEKKNAIEYYFENRYENEKYMTNKLITDIKDLF